MLDSFIFLLVFGGLCLIGLIVYRQYVKSKKQSDLAERSFRSAIGYYKRHIQVQEAELKSLYKSQMGLKLKLTETLTTHWSEALNHFWQGMQLEIDKREKLIDELSLRVSQLEEEASGEMDSLDEKEVALLLDRLRVLGEENLALREALNGLEVEKKELLDKIRLLSAENENMEAKFKEFDRSLRDIFGNKDMKPTKKKKKKAKKIRKPLAKALKAAKKRKLQVEDDFSSNIG